MIVTTKKVLPYLFRNKQWILSDKQTLRSMLQASKTSMKKPSDLAKQTQLNIVNRILQSHQTIQQINVLSQYVVSLRHERLMSKQTLDTIQKWIQGVWQKLNHFNRLSSSCFLVEQGRYSLFDRFYNQTQTFNKQFKPNYLQQLIYQYCKCIVNKKIYTNHKLIQKILPKSLQKWKKQQYLISQINKKQQIIRNQTKKQRSNLQIQVQALLVTLNYSFQRQVNICGFMVDFLLQNKKKQQVKQKQIESQTTKKCIIEVMGSHHYTVQHNLFGKDIMRALILEQIYPVAMVHANDINPLKGVQNRMNYIQELIQQANCRTDIKKRWEPILKQYTNFKSNLTKS